MMEHVVTYSYSQLAIVHGEHYNYVYVYTFANYFVLINMHYFYVSSVLTEDWRCDQYRWSNQGVRRLPKKDPRIKKSYFQVDTPNGPSGEFVKHAYELLPPNSNNVVLVHYMGDEKAAVSFAHGNAKGLERTRHIRTCPSVLRSIENECDQATPATAYRKLVTAVPPTMHMPVKQPRNTKQAKNIRSKLLEKHRLSHDALYNLHELASDVPDFVWSIRTHPDLVCVCGNKALLEELDRVLLIESPSPQLLSYDTTFQLGDFYVSTLTFRHTLFKEAPVVPACFLLHERKFEACHEELFSICSKLVPSLSKCTKPIVTDEEQAFANTIKRHVSLTHLRCWNHVFRASMRWLRSHGAPAQDVAVYLSDLRDLFHLPSEEEYTCSLERMARKWSAPFYDYYSHSLHPDIHAIARWAIEPYGVYDPYSGVTNNQAEGLNYVLKQLREWHESPVDCMVLALYYLQGYYLVEISRGKQGLGNYHLHAKFSPLVQVQPPLISEKNVYSPEDIVGRIKDARATLPPQSAAPSSPEKNSKPTYQLTQLERARRVIDENKISMDPKLHTFTVMGNERPHVVTLFPKEACSCPSTTECYHIMAARMSIGQNEQRERLRRLNLTQLRRNTRSRKDKKSGRKRPRPGDLDILPAPDSHAAAEAKTHMICQGGTDNDCIVTIMHGDLTEFSADVMVNAANEQLSHGGGIAGIISRKGGSIVQEESTKYVQHAGQLSTGDAVLLTGVGSLPCKAIIHAVGPRWNGGQNNEEAYLVKTVHNSLLEALKHNFASIAFPAISSGIFGVPIHICAKAMMQGIREFSSIDQSAQLKSITIVLLQEHHIAPFTQAAAGVLQNIVHTASNNQ